MELCAIYLARKTEVYNGKKKKDYSDFFFSPGKKGMQLCTFKVLITLVK